MSIEVHMSGREDIIGMWVLAGDGVIGEVQCTKRQALLLAAAPDLLAALKDLMALYYEGQLVLEDDNGLDPVIAAATVAIAQAEGRQGPCQPTEE